jgi:hypothetical protein
MALMMNKLAMVLVKLLLKNKNNLLGQKEKLF